MVDTEDGHSKPPGSDWWALHGLVEVYGGTELRWQVLHGENPRWSTNGENLQSKTIELYKFKKTWVPEVFSHEDGDVFHGHVNDCQMVFPLGNDQSSLWKRSSRAWSHQKRCHLRLKWSPIEQPRLNHWRCERLRSRFPRNPRKFGMSKINLYQVISIFPY